MNSILRRAAIILGALLLLAPFCQAQEKPASLTWFDGNWEFAYQDARLGEVHGLAAVRVEHDSMVLIRYTVTDPRDGVSHELTPFNIRYAENVLTMELSPGGPVAALDAEGRPLPATAGGTGIAVPGGARLKATLGDKEAEAGVVPISSRLSTRLRLVREGDRLTGEWQVTRDGNFGFAAARSGTRDTVVRNLPPPVGEVREEVVRGPEAWQSARMLVEKARRIAWKDAPAPGGDITGTADVALTGKNLPEPRRREVVFADPYLRPDNTALTGNLPVSIAARAVPGLKTFTLKDRENSQTTPGVWVFDWPPLPAKEIHYARLTAGGEFEPTSIIYFGELFYIEIEIARAAPGDLRLYSIETDAAKPVFFHVRRDPAQRTKFRAGPFLLLAPYESVEAGAVEAPEPAENQTTVSAPTAAHPFIVRALRNGARLRTSPVVVELGDPFAAAFAEAKEDHSDDGPYQRALRHAEDFRRRYPDPDRYNISKFTPLSGSRRTLITVQDHAALILLHSELLRSMDSLRRQQTRELSANERRALANSLMEASQQRVDLPIFYYDVSSPDGKSTMRLNTAVYPNTLREAFGNDTAKRDAYLDKVIAEAGNKMSEHAATGAAHIAEADISSPASLLPKIKAGYSAATASLMPRLMRRARPYNGEPATPRWVVDEIGRAAVRGVPDLLGAITADEELADMQWGALQIMALPAAIYTGALGAAGMLTRGAVALATAGDLVMGAGAANNLLRLGSAVEQRDTGWDAAPVAGYEAYRAARDEVFARGVTAAVDVPMTLIGAAAITAHVVKAGLRPSARAAQAAVAGALEKGVDSLSDSARAQFAMVLDSAARKVTGSGVDSLTELERAALRANFPDGIPSGIAKELKIPPDSPDFFIRVGDETLAGAAGKLPPVAEAPVVPRVAPEASSHPAIRRMFEENLNNSRLGVAEAQGREVQIQRAAAGWENLPADAQARAGEALETLNRLRRNNPELASLNEAEALEYFNFHSRARVGGIDMHRPVSPEELVAEFVRGKGRSTTAPQLSRAASISEANAEAALLEAERRLPPDTARPSSPPAPKAPPADPNAITVGPQPGPMPPPDAREIEVAAQLEKFGLSSVEAKAAAGVPAARSGDVRAGAAHAAMYRDVPARQVQDALGLKPEELRSMLDDYVRRFDPLSDSDRARMLDRYFGANDTVVEPRKLPNTPGTEPNFPRGLARETPKPEAARAEVVSALERMGVPRAETEILTPRDIFPRTDGLDARAVAAAQARRMDVPAPRAARALGISETEYAAQLDRAEAIQHPHLTPSQRAASVAADLGADGVTQPYSRVLGARQQQVEAALRDLGVSQSDPALITRAGLDPESAIVGQALENGVPARDIAARRGLTPERVADLTDEYLREGRQLTDSAGRAQRRTALLESNPLELPPEAPTVRLSPRVLATQDEIATALERLNVDPVVAGERAGQLANIARRDAHEAIIGGAWQSQVPPSALRAQFGYSDAQIARGLDAFLTNHVGMRNPANRAEFIARHYFGRHGQPLDAAAVRHMITGNEAATQPLRAVAVPPPQPPGAPPPRPPALPVEPNPGLDQRFGPAAHPLYARPGERTLEGAWRPNTGAAQVQPGTPLRLHPDLRYNWLMDQQGRLIIGAEQFIFQNGRLLLDESTGVPLRLGHPAMINGGPARIAGELQYVPGRGWVLNNMSGRYGLGRPELTPQHLQNAAAVFEKAGVRVIPEFAGPW